MPIHLFYFGYKNKKLTNNRISILFYGMFVLKSLTNLATENF